MLHVVHHPDYVVEQQAGAPQFSKYAAVMDALRAGGPLVEHRPDPMPREGIERAHDSAYVESVVSASVDRAVERRIGFAVTPTVARRSRLSVGGTWLAARLALEHGYAANAAGGSHHALPGTGAGYCVFNDLAIAALRLVAEGDARRVLVVDLDVHQGDGTAVILGGNPAMATLSLHSEKNFPARKARSTLDVPLADGTGDEEYLAALGRALDVMMARHRPDLILYQAGVDVHRDDKLGRLALTDAGIARRDRCVATVARAASVPLASAMGGGYGSDVARIAGRHAATMRSLAAAYFD